MSEYRRGDVVAVTFPHSDRSGATYRPALIVQADNLQTGLEQVVVALITANRSRRRHPSRVIITLDTEAGRESGLEADSVILTDNLATIKTARIARKLGRLPDMAKTDAALRKTLGL